MARTFAYLRVSTPEQTTENQVQEITASGFRVEPHRIVTETISGSVAISQRPEFARLADRLEPGDVLVVTVWARYVGKWYPDGSQWPVRLHGF